MMNEVELLSKDKQFISDALKLRFYPITIKNAVGCHITDTNGKKYLQINWRKFH